MHSNSVPFHLLGRVFPAWLINFQPRRRLDCDALSTLMYHSPVLQRSPTDDDDRLKRERTAASTTTQPPPSYTANSPTNSHFGPFSPTSRSHPQLAYGTQYPSRPTPTPSALPLPSGMSQSPRHGPPPSPTSNGLTHINTSMYPPRESGNSTYYDPTSEHREGSMAWGHSHSSTRSPRQVCTIGACKSYPRATLFTCDTYCACIL